MSVFKIEITQSVKRVRQGTREDVLVKKKFYESRDQFERWLKRHRETYSHVYKITGFKQTQGQWIETS